ncbi:MAG: S9 family peptidase, partial [Bryobacterales bacterium]|nr:S9 family peptidase [Bryobacterales bacterium]
MTFRYLLALAIAWQASAQSGRLQSSDQYKLRSVGAVRFSPDGARIAYTVSYNDGPGRPYSKIEILTLAGGAHIQISGGSSSNPVWSPDSRKIAYEGEVGGKAGLVVASADGSNPRFYSKMEGTNAPLTFVGASITWSPDGRQIAFVDARPGPETQQASGDPVVITRYLYKPNFSEGNTRFNDNKRLHIFLADVSSGAIRQLTDGPFYEHSLDWSPDGREILFVSNREPDSEQFFNDDIWTVRPADGRIRRVTATEYAEYQPRWSPDGKRIAYLGARRGLTDLETTMEDTHVWVMNADGSARTEIGKTVDNRQGEPEWSPDGQNLYFTVQERGNVRLYSLPANGGAAHPVVTEKGQVGSWSVAKGNRVAYAFSSPRDLAELFLLEAGGTKQLTRLNDAVLDGKTIAEVEAFTFVSNDFKYEVEAFLTWPLDRTAASKHPLIVNIHGGPHGQQGPAFNLKNQIYAGLGWASLMVNYRGSTGYGQRFADAVFGDQNGNEGQDVLYAVNAAIRRNPWIDRERMGI